MARQLSVAELESVSGGLSINLSAITLATLEAQLANMPSSLFYGSIPDMEIPTVFESSTQIDLGNIDITSNAGGM